MTKKLHELTLDELKELYADGKLKRDDLLVDINNGNTILHYFVIQKNLLPKFQWLKDLKLITKNDLLVKNNDGRTILHFLGFYSMGLFLLEENLLFILQCLKDLELITKDDLFVTDKFGNTMLDYLKDKDRKKVLALFDDEETSSAGKKANITDEMINKIREHLKAINNILTFNEE